MRLEALLALDAAVKAKREQEPEFQRKLTECQEVLAAQGFRGKPARELARHLVHKGFLAA